MTKFRAAGPGVVATAAGVMGVDALSPPELTPNIVTTVKMPKSAEVTQIELFRHGIFQTPVCLSRETEQERIRLTAHAPSGVISRSKAYG
jgi:hypothetical protein